MSRTTRLFVLMQTLRGYRYPVSGACLAEELGISLRTLYRDIAELKTLGADIEGEPGMGYVLKPGFLLPPLMFSESEIEALALGLSWVARRTDDELAASAGEALSKVAAILPAELRYRLEDSTLLVGPVAKSANIVALSTLHRAVREERRLAVAYLDAHGQSTIRTIWPLAITFFESVCMMVAWCELRESFRHFRTDRITEAKVLEQRYPQRRQVMLKTWKKTLLTETDSCSEYPA